MNESRAELKVIIRDVNSFTHFMGFVKTIKKDMTDIDIRENTMWYMRKSERFRKPVCMKTKVTFDEFRLFLIISRLMNIKIFCENDAFALQQG